MRLPQGRGHGRGLESVISWARAVEKQCQRKLRTMGGRAPLGTPSQGLLLSPLPGCWRTEGFHDSFQRKMALHILSLEDFALSVTSATMVSSRLLTYHTVTLGCAPCVCVCVHASSHSILYTALQILPHNGSQRWASPWLNHIFYTMILG